MESTYSTHANREASDDFTLTLRDICWDLTLTAPQAAAATQTFDLWQTEAVNFNAMNTNLGDYCFGFTYELIYVDGPFAADPHPSGDASLVGPDLTLTYTQTGLQYTGTPVTFNWLGTHKYLIRGTNGNTATAGNRRLYNSIDSNEFEIVIINPCLTSTVSAQPVSDYLTTVLAGVPTTWLYDEATDSASTTYGDGYDRCGARKHYLTDSNNSQTQYPDVSTHRRWLGLNYLADGDPADPVQPSTPPVVFFSL